MLTHVLVAVYIVCNLIVYTYIDTSLNYFHERTEPIMLPMSCPYILVSIKIFSK